MLNFRNRPLEKGGKRFKYYHYFPVTMSGQPSFFDIENKREELESKLRAESFPVTMAEMARTAEQMHRAYQKTKDDLKREDVEAINLEIMMDDEAQRKAKIDKLGSTAGQEFDFSDYMTIFYDDPRSEDLVAKTYERITIRGMEGPGTEGEEHLQTALKQTHYGAIERLREIQQEKPWLIELSERFIDVFGATFVGNGHRCIEGYEGLNFLDGLENAENSRQYGSAVQLPADQERAFVESIEDVTPLGRVPTFETETIDGKRVWNQDFNGWGGFAEGFMFIFKDREPMIGYMNRSFAHYPQEGEAWIVFSERKATEYITNKEVA